MENGTHFPFSTFHSQSVLFSHHLKDNIPHAVAGIALHKGQILPRADGDLAIHERDNDKRAEQRRFDMRQAVIIVPGIVVVRVDDRTGLIAEGEKTSIAALRSW